MKPIPTQNNKRDSRGVQLDRTTKKHSYSILTSILTEVLIKGKDNK